MPGSPREPAPGGFSAVRTGWPIFPHRLHKFEWESPPFGCAWRCGARTRGRRKQLPAPDPCPPRRHVLAV